MRELFCIGRAVGGVNSDNCTVLNVVEVLDRRGGIAKMIPDANRQAKRFSDGPAALRKPYLLGRWWHLLDMRLAGLCRSQSSAGRHPDAVHFSMLAGFASPPPTPRLS